MAFQAGPVRLGASTPGHHTGACDCPLMAVSGLPLESSASLARGSGSSGLRGDATCGGSTGRRPVVGWGLAGSRAGGCRPNTFVCPSRIWLLAWETNPCESVDFPHQGLTPRSAYHLRVTASVWWIGARIDPARSSERRSWIVDRLQGGLLSPRRAANTFSRCQLPDGHIIAE